MALSGSENSITIAPGDFTDSRVSALLREHLAGMQGSSPAGSVYALSATALQAPEVAFFAAWRGETLLGCGALKHLDPYWGEIKSMRTASTYLRQGVASRLLDHLLTLAHSRGYRRVSLETGSGPAFEAALALYSKRGFQDGAAFGEYPSTAFNRFLHLDLCGL